MKIKSLHLRDGLSTGSYDFGNLTVITSRHNKSGKTTLLRCLLYSLGYPIPSMSGMSFEKMNFDVAIQSDSGRELRLSRFNETIELAQSGTEETTTFSLPADRTRLHQMVFGIENETVLDNLLGTFYFDQEKGWTLLNRGTVIGSIHFSIEDFLRGLTGRSCSQEREKLAAVQQDISKYQHMLNVAQYKLELTESGDAVPFDTPAEEIMREVLRLRNKRKPMENEVRRLKGTIKDNEEFRRYIDSMQLRVKTPNGETILVTAENIVGFSDMRQYLRAKLVTLQGQIAVIDNQIKSFETRQKENETLFSVETTIQRFAEELAHISVDAPAVERILKSLRSQKDKLKEVIRDALKRERTTVEGLTNSILGYLREFGIEERFGRDIFTSDLKSLSGTIFHLQVFAFTISYAKLVRERTGIVLPLIIDSPNGREVERSTVQKMMEILLRDFAQHQLIIATIYNPMLSEQNTIELDNGVVGFERVEVDNGTESLPTQGPLVSAPIDIATRLREKDQK